jgi:hypothetical protein
LRRKPTLDGLVVPVLLCLVGRDLLLFDPPRVLAWRALHDPRLGSFASVLGPLLSWADQDRDPMALLLGTMAFGLALVYLAASLSGASSRVRAGLVATAASCLVLLPSAAFIAMGISTGRPYGQDGGVVQLPLALGRLSALESPYGADYSDSILGKESRASDFWTQHGGNPILHHHAYLPGTHLLMFPFYRLLGSAFDPRFVTLLALALATVLAGALLEDPDRRLAAAALVCLNPFAYWLQIFGANDILGVCLLIAALLVGRKRPGWAAVLVGLACATKQLAWPFAPFLLVFLARFERVGSLGSWTRLLRLGSVAFLTFGVVVLPVAALDWRAFWGDIVAYNVGLPGAENYPLGGTPGFGAANFILYAGGVRSLRDYVPFSRAYLLLVPLGLLLVARLVREQREAVALATSVAALLASLYLSRVVHPNYLILAAILLPLAGLLGRGLPPDVVVVPLLLLGWAVEVAQHELFRASWEDALAVRLPFHWGRALDLLGPRSGPELTQDPLGLLLSALAAGLATLYLCLGVLRVGPRARWGLLGVGVVVILVLPTWIVTGIGQVSGVPRAESPAVASAYAAAPWAPDAPREAWSLSFKRDPPGILEPHPSPLASGVYPVMRLLGGDPRVLGVVASVVLVVAFVLAGAPEDRLVWTGLLLSPAFALGVVFGSTDALLLAAFVGVWCSPRLSSLLGAVTSLAPRGLFGVPLALAGRAGPAGFGVGWLGLLAVGFWMHPSWTWDASGPGIGLPNLWPGGGGLRAGLLGLVSCLVAAWAAVWARGRAPDPRVGIAFFWLLGLFVLPGASALDVSGPLILLIAAAPSRGG